MLICKVTMTTLMQAQVLKRTRATLIII